MIYFLTWQEDGRDPVRSGKEAGKEARDIRKLPDSVQLHIPRSEPKITKRVSFFSVTFLVDSQIFYFVLIQGIYR